MCTVWQTSEKPSTGLLHTRRDLTTSGGLTRAECPIQDLGWWVIPYSTILQATMPYLQTNTLFQTPCQLACVREIRWSNWGEREKLNEKGRQTATERMKKKLQQRDKELVQCGYCWSSPQQLCLMFSCHPQRCNLASFRARVSEQSRHLCGFNPHTQAWLRIMSWLRERERERKHSGAHL